MYQIDYALRFTGKARTASADGNLLNVSMTAQSARVSSHIGDIGIKSLDRSAAGRSRGFQFRGDLHFRNRVSGNGRHYLWRWQHLALFDRGQRLPGALRRTRPAAGRRDVAHRAGEGQFAGASGMITSNFFVSDQLAKEDYHCGVLLLP